MPHPPEPEPLPDLHSEGVHLPGRKSISSLASDIDSELLRGVPMDRCLEFWGRHFTHTRKANDYHLSQRVDVIDSFLSHDWKTRRWLKLFTMLVYFNSVPAAVASLLMCLLVCILIILELLPGGWLVGTHCTHGAFWFVFAFWQRIRGLFKKNMVFLDRLCISQHDDRLKAEGILALGGFLSKSKRLVVLWSPRYFTRLWTAFELASFLKHDQVRAKNIEFAPASMGPLILCFSAFETLLVACFHLLIVQDVQVRLGNLNPVIGEQEDRYWDFMLAVLVIASPALLLILPVSLYFGTKQMLALVQLKTQLSNFKIRESQCSCCEWDHANPETGEEVICDRKLVFQTLKRWFPHESDPEGHLDKFDEIVRTELGGFVQEILGSGAPHLRFVLANTAPPLLGILCHYVYMAVNDPFDWTALGWMIGWFQIPPLMLLSFWEVLLAWRIGAKYYGRVPLWIVLPSCIILGVPFNNLLWFQYAAMKYTFGQRFNWPVAGSLLFMWVVAAIPYIWEYCAWSPKSCCSLTARAKY